MRRRATSTASDVGCCFFLMILFIFFLSQKVRNQSRFFNVKQKSFYSHCHLRLFMFHRHWKADYMYSGIKDTLLPQGTKHFLTLVNITITCTIYEAGSILVHVFCRGTVCLCWRWKSKLWCWNKRDESSCHTQVCAVNWNPERKASDVADSINKEHGRNMFHQLQLLDQELHLHWAFALLLLVKRENQSDIYQFNTTPNVVFIHLGFYVRIFF